MKYTMIGILIFLSGCSSTVQNNVIEQAIEHCSSNGGLYSINVAPGDTTMWVHCKNNTSTEIQR